MPITAYGFSVEYNLSEEPIEYRLVSVLDGLNRAGDKAGDRLKLELKSLLTGNSIFCCRQNHAGVYSMNLLEFPFSGILKRQKWTWIGITLHNSASGESSAHSMLHERG
jgi:hypothetical protein